MKQQKYILLSFDLEEFDIPLEYGQQLDKEHQLRIGYQGLQRLIPLLTQYQLKCTFFTTATFAQAFQRDIKELNKTHEIASHGYTHTGFEPEDYKKSKLELERIIQKPVVGFRMPRLASVDLDAIQQAGYQYDSSIHPTWIPGRYNYRHLPESIYEEESVIRIPCSVSPSPVRFPLFWLSFKNFPLWFYQYWLDQTLKKHDMACLYFHPWEYADLGEFKLPRIVKSVSGQQLLDKLERLITYYKQQGVEFISITDYLERKRLGYN